ncbi:hypothetical protein MHH60_14075 [Paenibacillus sp. FSL H7-0716]|uniref:Uncharacterized protein n=1 Tax=Paenibacillus odorifer TaxID=189426 RepID=A0AB36JJ60_9BACL|nr:hypothetical protein [Paenibacillus odorifer]OME23560.1 hypothetical protein BSK47_03650 [Paenibacillus odorifer]
MTMELKSDYFIFNSGNIKIDYIRESILNSYAQLPKIFWNYTPFNNYSINNNLISIEIDEWLSFYSKLHEMFKRDLRLMDCFTRNMRETLFTYQKITEQNLKTYIEYQHIDKKLLNENFYLYQTAQSYAFFNIALPVNYFNSEIKEYYDSKYSLDDFLISSVEPHRNQYRMKELSICRDILKGQICDDRIEEYRQNELLYTRFVDWNFYQPYFDSRQSVDLRLKKILATLSFEDITSELQFLRKNRNNQLKKIYRILREETDKWSNEVNAKMKSMIIFMVNIATEEEYRHKTDAKFMYLVGRVAYERGIDIARTPKEELINFMSLILRKDPMHNEKKYSDIL